MSQPDQCCSLHPYFRIHEGKVEDFKALSRAFTAKTRTEPGCLFYCFSFDGQDAHCREGYVDADALLFHIEHLGPEIQQSLAISDLVRIEVHATAADVAKLREPLKEMSPKFFTLENGFRN